MFNRKLGVFVCVVVLSSILIVYLSESAWFSSLLVLVEFPPAPPVAAGSTVSSSLVEILGCNLSLIMSDRVKFKSLVSWSKEKVLSITNCSLDKIDVTFAQTCLRSSSKRNGIQLIGDSVTRYQYLNLVYFLATGNWTSDPSQPNECEAQYSSWNEFYSVTNERMQGHEICDCSRNPGETIIENRYFQMEELLVTYRQLFSPSYPILAHNTTLLNISSCATHCQQAFCAPGQCGPATADNMSFAITPGSLSALINAHTARDVFINAGIWWNSYGRNTVEDFAEIWKNELARVKPSHRVHWKMTTATQLAWGPEYGFVDSMVADGHLFSVFDTYALTFPLFEQGLLAEAMWDVFHFFPPIYVGLNQALLGYLCTLPD